VTRGFHGQTLFCVSERRKMKKERNKKSNMNESVNHRLIINDFFLKKHGTKEGK
jgi:hypothetical protein